ncbi:uncharacterized protein LOC122973984 isoform X1 [Thunnus albacares]|uniref:uncharacterized protein LOC122973984 isoform X1 n=1 Tax=Thunnus albacares TaxID=8236 RepID=UPI001CF6C4D3|nr:uncharacterized protein LOC122973984 isoform X1 [Thunnus albacares]
MFKFYVLLVPLSRAYGALLYANLGDNVTLPCSYDSGAKYLCWYKQVAGEQPEIISSFYKHLPDSNNFHNQFKNNKRFSVHTGERFYHLNISNVQHMDSAMYFCGQTSITVTEFHDGILLVFKESRHLSFLQQPISDSVQAGGSVTLNCTVYTGTSDREHSVYWYKKDSGDSHLGIMYIHTHSSTQCVKSFESESPAQSCVYSLSKRNVSLSDAGTYYCALASCGEILFGKGTRLNVGGKQHDTLPVLVHGLVAVLLVSVILNVILTCILCNMARRKHIHSGGPHPQPSAPEYTAGSQNEESGALQYVALDFKKRQRKGRRQRSTEKEMIYSGLRVSDLD